MLTPMGPAIGRATVPPSFKYSVSPFLNHVFAFRRRLAAAGVLHRGRKAGPQPVEERGLAIALRQRAHRAGRVAIGLARGRRRWSVANGHRPVGAIRARCHRRQNKAVGKTTSPARDPISGSRVVATSRIDVHRGGSPGAGPEGLLRDRNPV